MNHIRCVVQARTDSSRLPAKALLPLRGYPLAILAALRAANDGLDVVLATSARPADDALARLALDHGLAVFRGEALDVRKRFIDATEDLHDDDVLVRLTADNPIPDGGLVRELVSEFLAGTALIASLGAPTRTLPYGLSAEAMRVRSLRQSVSWRDDAYAREHVTPALWDRQGPYTSSIAHPVGDLSHLRCTVDSLDDYQRVVRVFEGSSDPIDAPWRDLVGTLATLPDAPRRLLPGPGLSLGTVQLGTTYGSVVPVEPPPRAVSFSMLRTALDHGAHLDTARAYGTAEELIGTVVKERGPSGVLVVTKLDPLGDVAADSPPAVAEARAEASVFRSLALLGRDARPGLLLHRAVHRTAWGGAVWRALQRLEDDGWLSRIGVSVANPVELTEALGDPRVKVVQCSRNLLDHRWNTDEVQAALATRTDVEVQVRSAFLQGVLLGPSTAWPAVDGVDGARISDVLDHLVAALDRENRADLCLAWLRAGRGPESRVDRIVVGAQNPDQLDRNLEYWTRPALTSDEVALCSSSLPHVPLQLLDPALWPKRKAK